MRLIQKVHAIVMEAIPNHSFLEYNPDTLQHLRELYGFDQQRMNESIDIIEEWLKKQEHFVKKTFPREYLERIIIHNKGSVEKSKKKLDRLCTLRTLLPEFFVNHNARELLTQDMCEDYLMPKMTPDYHRVYIIKPNNVKYSTFKINQHLHYFLLISDFLQIYDYCNGLIIVGDWREGNPIDYGMSVNFSDFRKTLDIAFSVPAKAKIIIADIYLILGVLVKVPTKSIFAKEFIIDEGHSMRIIGIHLLTGSMAVEAFVALLKQVVSPKIGNRIQTHKSMDTVYKYIPKDFLPEEYGGKQKPLAELRENLINALDSDEFKKYKKDINEARTDEAFRPKDVFNEYMGMSGTFRNLSVD